MVARAAKPTRAIALTGSLCPTWRAEFFTPPVGCMLSSRSSECRCVRRELPAGQRQAPHYVQCGLLLAAAGLGQFDRRQPPGGRKGHQLVAEVWTGLALPVNAGVR